MNEKVLRPFRTYSRGDKIRLGDRKTVAPATQLQIPIPR